MEKKETKMDSLDIHEKLRVVDLHVHPCLKTYLFSTKLYKKHRAGGAWNPLQMRVDLPKMKQGGVNALFSSIYFPEKDLLNDCKLLRAGVGIMGLFSKKFRGISKGNAFEETVRMIDHFEKAVKKAREKGWGDVDIAHSLSELDALLDNGKSAIVHTVEGGHSLCGKIENLEAFFARGVSLLTIAHFYENKVTRCVGGIPDSKKILGCFKYSVVQEEGLTDFGKGVIEEMIRLGMLIDLTHSTPKARRQVYEINNNRKPLVCSHVGVQALKQHPMNVSDAEIKTIADCGGVIGVIFMDYWLSPEDPKYGLDLIVKTIRHIREKGGIETAAVGSDFDGFTDPPDDIKDIAEMPKLTDALLKAGFSEDEIEKIWAKNVLRVVHDGWGKE